LVGIPGGHLALDAGYRSGLGDLGRVPVVDLTVTAVGLPCSPLWPVGCSRDANHPPSHGNRSIQ
jgi:hypothetical protein